LGLCGNAAAPCAGLTSGFEQEGAQTGASVVCIAYRNKHARNDKQEEDDEDDKEEEEEEEEVVVVVEEDDDDEDDDEEEEKEEEEKEEEEKEEEKKLTNKKNNSPGSEMSPLLSLPGASSERRQARV